MRSYALEQGVSVSQLDYLPATFVLRPGGELLDERQQFLAEFERQEKMIAASASPSDNVSAGDPSTIAATPRNAWIVKANRGAKGSSIFVSDNAAELLAYVDAQGEKQREDEERTSIVADFCALTPFLSPLVFFAFQRPTT